MGQLERQGSETRPPETAGLREEAQSRSRTADAQQCEMEELIRNGTGALISRLTPFHFCVVVTPNTNTDFSLSAHSLRFPEGQRPKNIPAFKSSHLGLTC